MGIVDELYFDKLPAKFDTGKSFCLASIWHDLPARYTEITLRVTDESGNAFEYPTPGLPSVYDRTVQALSLAGVSIYEQGGHLFSLLVDGNPIASTALMVRTVARIPSSLV